jgi:hypothetical protein
MREQTTVAWFTVFPRERALEPLALDWRNEHVMSPECASSWSWTPSKRSSRPRTAPWRYCSPRRRAAGSSFYAEQKDLWLRDGVAWGRLAPLRVFDDSSKWFPRARRKAAKLGEFDVILMRKDPPFDTEYIYSTYILDRAQLQGALVCNRPQGLRDINEKVYTAWFPQCCAPTLITRDMHDMANSARARQGGVQALDGMGGKSIFVLEQGDKNRNVVFETLTGYGTRYAIVQRYLPEIVTAGDCRIILSTESRCPTPCSAFRCLKTTAAIWRPARAPKAARSTIATDGCARKSDLSCAMRA